MRLGPSLAGPSLADRRLDDLMRTDRTRAVRAASSTGRPKPRTGRSRPLAHLLREPVSAAARDKNARASGKEAANVASAAMVSHAVGDAVGVAGGAAVAAAPERTQLLQTEISRVAVASTRSTPAKGRENTARMSLMGMVTNAGLQKPLMTTLMGPASPPCTLTSPAASLASTLVSPNKRANGRSRPAKAAERTNRENRGNRASTNPASRAAIPNNARDQEHATN